MKKAQVIGPRVIDNLMYIKKLARTKSDKKRLDLLRNANTEELLSIVEIALNILSSNFLLSNIQKKKLLPHSNYIRKLAKVRSEKGARKVIQYGGGAFLPALLIPVIAEAVRFLLTKNN